MRTLIYVPVLHTEVEIGSMSELLSREYISRYGEEAWRKHVEIIDEMWKGIRRRLFDSGLPFKKMRVYQDGLPVCGKEIEIARESAEKGSENFKIVMELVCRGAKLEGTEDPNLLLEEYNYLKRVTQIMDPAERDRVIKEYAPRATDLLERRDKFIADRIDITLLPSETGVLFMGMRHQVDEKLPKDIGVQYLIHRLPFRVAQTFTESQEKEGGDLQG